MKVAFLNTAPSSNLSEDQVMEILTRNLPSPNELKRHAISMREKRLKEEGSVKGRSYLRKELFELRNAE
jgi:hypothetical protein